MGSRAPQQGERLSLRVLALLLRPTPDQHHSGAPGRDCVPEMPGTGVPHAVACSELPSEIGAPSRRFTQIYPAWLVRGVENSIGC
jgi:hypothetical protein